MELGTRDEALDSFPDLGDIPAGCLRTRLALCRTAHGPRVHGVSTDVCLFNLVRLAEKAHWEYNAARAHYVRMRAASGAVNVMGCRDRLEDCVNSTFRAYLYVEAVVDAKRQADSRSAIDDAIAAELRKVKARRKSLRRLREAIRRCDERLGSKRQSVPDVAPLSIREADITCGSYSLSYIDLERLVRTLHEITSAVTSP